MLDFGTYIRIILVKKQLTQQDVVDRVNQLGLMENGAIFTKQKFSNMLNGIIPLSKRYAKRLEKALELQNGSLNMFITSRR